MRYFLIIFILLPVMACAQTIEIPLSSPGHLGMISNIGASEQPMGSMRYSLNVDVFSKPGVLQKRLGFEAYGGTNLHLYGATGYYNPYDNHRLIVGVHDSTFVWFDTLGAAHSSQVGHFFVSDTFTTNPDIGVTGLVFPYRDSYHDWLPYRDLLIHCDGKSTPIVFTTSQTFFYQDSAFDTSGYEPHAISMGLEAPGQLRVGLTDIGGPLDGIYRYSYAYIDVSDSSISKMALPSAVIKASGECPYLTQFEEPGSTLDTLDKLVLRQKMDRRGVWYVIDTLKVAYVDSAVTVARLYMHFSANGWGPYDDRMYDNYTYKIILTTDNGTVDSAYIVTTNSMGRNTAVGLMVDSLNSMARLGDSVIASKVQDAGYTVTLTTVSPLHGFTYTNDTGTTVIMIMDSLFWNASTAQVVYVDAISDSAVIEWQYAAMKCSINTLTGSFDYEVSIGYNDNADTSTVIYTSDGSPTDAEVCAGLVAAINADDSISLRVTAYDSSVFYIIKVDSLHLLLDSLCFDAKQDTVRVRNTRWDPSAIDTTMRTPGGLLSDSLTTSGGSQSVTTASGLHAMIDSVYPIAYSYYDPATGFESPLGPSLHTKLSDSSGNADTAVFRSVSTGWPADGRPGWIRLYQGVVKNSVTGFGDTTIWYGLYQMRTRDSARTIIWGNWQDDSVSLGLDTSLITVDTIYRRQQFWTATGDVVVQPPYHYDLQIPFTDMEYAHFRFYGIGDPFGPNRIYYTPVDTISWYPYDYFEIEPGADEFVAIEELYGTLYAFKHNSIWYLAGYDAEMETMWGRVIGTTVEVRQLTAQYGAVSRKTVCKYGDAIYFLTPNGKVMVIDDQGISELSAPIQDRVDTMFSDHAAITSYAHLVGWEETIKLSNDSTGVVLSMHIPSQTWGHEDYTGTPGYTVERMFVYDSASGDMECSEIVFGEGTGTFMRQSRSGIRNDQVLGGFFDWAAEFPTAGDGLHFYAIEGLTIKQDVVGTTYLYATTYNADGDSLTSDSISLSTGTNGFISWDLTPHSLTTYPFLRLWGKTYPNRTNIESIIFTIRNHGDIYAQ